MLLGLNREENLRPRSRRKVQDALAQLRTGWGTPSLVSVQQSCFNSDVQIDQRTLRWLEHDFNYNDPRSAVRNRTINIGSQQDATSDEDHRKEQEQSVQLEQHEESWVELPLHKHGLTHGRSVDVRGRHSSFDNLRSALDNRNEWDCNIFALDKNSERGPLYTMAHALIHDYGLTEKLDIPTSALHNFLKGLEDGYEEVPYHNSTHAADVLHALHFFLRSSDMSRHMTSLELLAALVAAAAHDFKHPGVNNAFLINSGHELAVRYNDRSPLENFHAAEMFGLLSKASADILIGLSSQERHTFRHIVIEMILATDMAQHFSNVSEFKAKLEAGLNLEEHNDRLEFLKFMLKCADISNPAKDRELATSWAYRVTREKLDQGRRESEMGIEVNGVSDQGNFSTARNQIDFIDFIVYPTLSLLWMFETSLRDVLESRLQKSRNTWCELLEREDPCLARSLSPASNTANPRQSYENH